LYGRGEKDILHEKNAPQARFFYETECAARRIMKQNALQANFFG